MAMASHWIGLTVAFTTAFACTSARADLQLCNRMSYVVDAALAFEQGGSAMSRGWYRLDPGQCRHVMQGALPPGQMFVHARAPKIYGPSPLPQRGDTEFCVAPDNFSNGNARNCRGSQKPVPFSAAAPAQSEQGAVVTLAEEAGYDSDQARDAGLQRLLAVAGYDPGPIDGVRGERTDNAIRQFALDNKLPVTAAARADIFAALIDIAQKPGGAFSWCNDTPYAVMAALGIEDGNGVTTRGWYRVEPGRCLRPDIAGEPKRIFSFAEAVDTNGRALTAGAQPMAWGGSHPMCTRPTRFEFYDQIDCTGRGLSQTGFAAIEIGGKEAAVLRFK